ARAIVLANPPGGDQDIARAVFDAFFGSFLWWCLSVVLAGAILAASAVSVTHHIDPADLPALAWAAIRREPESTWGKVVGALVLLALGAATIRDPLGALRLVTVIVGAWMVFAAVVTLLRLLVGPPTSDELPPARAFRRRIAPVLAGAVVLV